MSRQRAFCRYCGQLIRPEQSTPARLYACTAHRDLLTEDYRHDHAAYDESLIPPGPATSLPTMYEQAAHDLREAAPPTRRAEPF